jgi:ATP-dependent DNA helicase RecG
MSIALDTKSKINQIENQSTEFKLVWKDDYLKTICAFANSIGGCLYLGVDDDGVIVGIDNASKLLEVLPNKINNYLGVLVDFELASSGDLQYLCLVIKQSYAPISYGGRFYKRSGSNTIEINGSDLAGFLLNHYGKTWDEAPVDNFTLEDVDRATIAKFKQLAKDRIPNIDQEQDLSVLLQKLNLYDGHHFKRAAILLFAKNPQRYFIQSHSKIGRFLSETDIQTSDIIEGNLFEQVDTILDILRSKYLKAFIHFEGAHRREILELPYIALREAIINALIHRDYMIPSNLQVKVYDDRLVMSNGATLPEQFSIASFTKPHQSLPRAGCVGSSSREALHGTSLSRCAP